MIRENIYKYNPDYAVPSGDTLVELLENKRMTQTELADRTGRRLKTINEIVKGKAPITPETALQFERVLGVPANFWNNLEKNYRQSLVKINESILLEDELDILREIPVNLYIRYGWIEKAENDIQQIRELLNFYSVASPKQLRERTYETVAFRQSKRIKGDPWLIAGWLRKGKIEAQKIECEGFSREVFLESLRKIRILTQENMNPNLCDKWRELCSKAGVALVFEKEAPRLGLNGATYWIKDKAVIQLSLLYKYSDILWFTFFHEAGHIILHGRKNVFLENKEKKVKAEELEADKFSSNFLINPVEYKEFVNSCVISASSIQNFAKSLKINPGIVLGRLQHDKLVPYSHLTHLRKKLQWGLR